MDTYIDARFERVERALVTLTESIAKYTPQSAAAHELAAADRALAEGLQLLQAHQTNHTLLASLKAASSALDAQIRDTMRLLWNTRHDMSSTNITTMPAEGPRSDVSWQDLLQYASRISKTTMPASSVLASAAAAATAAASATAGVGAGASGEESEASTGDAAGTPNTTAAQTPATGAQTPAGANGAARSPAPVVGQVAAQQQAASGTALPEEWNRFLDPLTDQTFQPWPTEHTIRRSALASLEGLMAQGIDPRGYDPAEEEAKRKREEEARRVQEEKEMQEREENLRRLREEEARIARERHRERERAQEEAMRRGSVIGQGTMSYGGSGPSPTTTQPGRSQFQFMGLDDDEDD